METHIRLRSFLALAASALLAVGIAGLSSLPASANEPAVGFSQLDEDEVALFYSGEPVTVQVDPATGVFQSVELTEPEAQPRAVYPTCSGNQACWRGWLTPHLWYGFDGTGASGTWANRGAFYTGVYYAMPCWAWAGSTICTEAYLPPSHTTSWGVELTGKAVYLY